MDQADYPFIWTEKMQQTLESQYPIHAICQKGDHEMLDQFLHQFPSNLHQEECFNKWTLAHFAAFCGKLKCLIRLQHHNFNFAQLEKPHTQTPLHWAAYANQHHCIKWLKQIGFDANHEDELKETALHKAVRGDALYSCQVLLQVGANPRAVNMWDQSALDLSDRLGHVVISNYLRMHTSRSLSPSGFMPSPPSPIPQHDMAEINFEENVTESENPHQRKRSFTTSDSCQFVDAKRFCVGAGGDDNSLNNSSSLFSSMRTFSVLQVSTEPVKYQRTPAPLPCMYQPMM